MRKIVIFGERKGPNTDPFNPLYPHTTHGAAARLIRMFGVDVNEYLENTARYNVFQHGHQDFSLEEARERVGTLHLRHLEEDPKCEFIFLGKAALRGAPNPEWRELQYFQSLGAVHLIPHPSGANLVYNDAENVRQAALLLRGVWERAKL
ncbi:MAG: hypothetical protein AB7V46_18160 [Thermomicrobiales bacterium]